MILPSAGFRYHMFTFGLLFLLLLWVSACFSVLDVLHRTRNLQGFVVIILSNCPKKNKICTKCGFVNIAINRNLHYSYYCINEFAVYPSLHNRLVGPWQSSLIVLIAERQFKCSGILI